MARKDTGKNQRKAGLFFARGTRRFFTKIQRFSKEPPMPAGLAQQENENDFPPSEEIFLGTTHDNWSSQQDYENG